MFVVRYDVDACGGVSVIVDVVTSEVSNTKDACYVIHTPPHYAVDGPQETSTLGCPPCTNVLETLFNLPRAK